MMYTSNFSTPARTHVRKKPELAIDFETLRAFVRALITTLIGSLLPVAVLAGTVYTLHRWPNVSPIIGLLVAGSLLTLALFLSCFRGRA